MAENTKILKLNLDCCYFIGEKPCKYGCLCPGCEHYKKMGYRILIIKQAALGDVLRTTAVLSGLKRKYPDSHITWLTAPRAKDLLLENSLIDRVYTFGLETIVRLQVEEFDELICLDKEPSSTAMAVLTRAGIKKGFLMQEQGNVCPANKEAEYTFSLGLSDELKFKKNKKTYQQLIYEVCDLKYEADEYVFKLTDEEKDFAQNKFGSRLKPNKPVIGLNIGSDKMFAGKSWRLDGFIELAQKLYRDIGADILILGGAVEQKKNRVLVEKLTALKVPVIDSGCDNDLRQFAGIVNLCDIIVTGDTLCLHIGIGLKKKIAALFASTCAQEIDLYNRGEFIISPAECAPCYRKDCPYDLKCMDLISVDSVYTAVKGLLK